MIRELQEQIRQMLERGVPIDDVDEQVITPAPLESAQKGALWLYAWSRLDPDDQQRIAAEHLAAVS